MARRTSKHLRAPRPLLSSHASAAIKSDGRWVVRTVSSDRATKAYTCPWCQRPIGVGVSHVVAWPDTPAWNQDRAVDARRHFHTGCWNWRP